MRLFTDQDVYALTVSFLRTLGHDIETATEAGLATARDKEILKHCAQHDRALVTRDKDFGNLVFLRGLPCPGVILIRSDPLHLPAAHQQLEAALRTHGDLDGILVVVEVGRYRIRRS